jgi:hypothetical protein
MHGSIQLIIASETDKLRHTDAARARRSAPRSRFARMRARARVAAHGVPPRAAPGTDSLGRPSAAFPRGR